MKMISVRLLPLVFVVLCVQQDSFAYEYEYESCWLYTISSKTNCIAELGGSNKTCSGCSGPEDAVCDNTSYVEASTKVPKADLLRDHYTEIGGGSSGFQTADIEIIECGEAGECDSGCEEVTDGGVTYYKCTLATAQDVLLGYFKGIGSCP